LKCNTYDSTGEEIKIVTVPPFAESVSEGDVRWEKGKQICHSDSVIPLSLLVMLLPLLLLKMASYENCRYMKNCFGMHDISAYLIYCIASLFSLIECYS
jgi:hypothetical protein